MNGCSHPDPIVKHTSPEQPFPPAPPALTHSDRFALVIATFILRMSDTKPRPRVEEAADALTQDTITTSLSCPWNASTVLQYNALLPAARAATPSRGLTGGLGIGVGCRSGLEPFKAPFAPLPMLLSPPPPAGMPAVSG